MTICVSNDFPNKYLVNPKHLSQVPIVDYNTGNKRCFLPTPEKLILKICLLTQDLIILSDRQKTEEIFLTYFCSLKQIRHSLFYWKNRSFEVLKNLWLTSFCVRKKHNFNWQDFTSKRELFKYLHEKSSLIKLKWIVNKVFCDV